MSTHRFPPSTSAYRNDKIIAVCTQSGIRGSIRDPAGPASIFDVNVGDHELGEGVRACLAASRHLTNEEFAYLADLTRLKTSYEAWVAELMHACRAGTRRALFKSMMQCVVTQMSDAIEFAPYIHERLEGWGRTKDDGIENVTLPLGSTSAEIGAALRLAFSRCTWSRSF